MGEGRIIPTLHESGVHGWTRGQVVTFGNIMLLDYYRILCYSMDNVKHRNNVQGR